MISRKETKLILDQWNAGAIGAEAVWQWAEKNKAAGESEDALVRDIIDVLASLPFDLITEEDAEVMAYGLSNPAEEADLAQNLLWNHLDGVDTESRRTALAEDPFYGPFLLGESDHF